MFSKIALAWRMLRYRMVSWLGPDVSEVYQGIGDRILRERMFEHDPWQRARMSDEAAYYHQRARDTESGHRS